MSLLSLFLRFFKRVLQNVNFKTVSLFLLLHMSLTYTGLAWAKELSITERLMDFFYFYIVTLSSTGYGDLLAQTDAGRLIVTFWVIPSGLLLYTTFFAKAIETITQNYTNKIQGNIMLNVSNHILILGWSKNTRQLIELTLADPKHENKTIVLGVTNDDATHPMPECDRLAFVKLSSYTNDSELERVCLSTADFVIVNADNDDTNFTVCIHISPLNTSAHITTFFKDATRSLSLQRINPNIEASCDRVAETLQKSMFDPGTSVVFTLLMDPRQGATTYVIEHNFTAPVTARDLKLHMMDTLNATFIGLSEDPNGRTLMLSPDNAHVIQGKQYIHYVADQRLSSLSL